VTLITGPVGTAVLFFVALDVFFEDDFFLAIISVSFQIKMIRKGFI